MYRKLVMYFSSGTGNTYRVSRWMEAAAKEKGMETELRNMYSVKKAEIAAPAKDTLTGILFPTLGCISPLSVLRFVLSLPGGRGAHAFAVAVHGELRLGKLILPGHSGSGDCIVALLLALKGYKVRGMQGVPMPANITSGHPGMGKSAIERVQARARKRLDKITSALFAGKKSIRGIPTFLFSLVFLPVVPLYLLGGRFVLAKLFFANNQCTGCGLCGKSCNVGAIRMLGKKNPRPYWTCSCEVCMRCMNYCPTRAIEAGHSWMLLMFYLLTIPLGTYAFNYITKVIGWQVLKDSVLLHQLSNYLCFLFAVFASYFVFNQLVRIPLVNRLFTYTTLTHYYKRYHDPETKLGEMTSI